ncbi:hypothetical protein [Tengunoibacter tsumagoiensis]|uniref:HAMP domain-containing protein n=1 Tax=Tengunoibacter tsumagoiensis TaxID=2014871 RepID=A0A402AA89_9CHLR|nr:hypothetical protein [Tengunoibacter tsumagoiensis]GCE16092.1 hypothetical protein KTT_59510 [Tengunoibacter tsumagoiensis]
MDERKLWSSIEQERAHEHPGLLQEISGGIMRAWFRFSTPNAKFRAQHPDPLSQSQLASLLLLMGIITAIAFIPSAIVSVHMHTLFPVLGLLLVLFICIPLNRAGRVAVVGVLLILAIDATIMISLLSYPGLMLSQNAIPIYDLFVLSDIVAVSLLPRKSILYISLFHSIFICADVYLQPHTADLHELLLRTNYSIMVRPLAIQLLVAIVTYAWVRNTVQAVKRADQAELVAQLEHELAQQKKNLDEGIQSILQTLVQSANGDMQVRAPLSRDNVLWQLGSALNILLARLQRAQQNERQLQQMRSELARVLYTVQEARKRQKSIELMPGGTEVDPLISELLHSYLVPSPPHFRDK